MLRFLVYCESQLKDQLPGGRFFNPDFNLCEVAASCSSSNISVERSFGVLDKDIHRAPAATANYLQSKQLFVCNKTAAWLSTKCEEDHGRILAAARPLARQQMKDARVEEKALLAAKIVQLQAKQAAMAESEARKRLRAENILCDLFRYGGLWQSVGDMESQLKKLPRDATKKAAVKVQLKVRKTFLQQASNPSLYAFSIHGKPHPLTVLVKNLHTLLLDIVIDESREEIEKCLRDPGLLCGKLVLHKWVNEEGRDVTYEGRISGELIEKNGVTEFEIKYFNGEICYLEFDEVMTDIHNGDLTVHWE